MSLSITSFSFSLFVTIVVFVYYVVPKNRWIVLCVASCLYYVYISNGYIVPILVSLITLWIGSIYIDNNNQQTKEKDKSEKKAIKGKNKIALCLTIGINISLLLFYKFASNMILPLAISFYTLSGIGYIIDVYKGNESERNVCKLALFLCFFPLVTQGPIVRYRKLKSTLYKDNHFKFENIVSGIILIFWGGIKKLVIADRVYPLVNGVFSDYSTYSGLIIPIAVVGYMVQLYCDFSGGIDIIIGCGEMLGISLPENFRQPYFSTSVSEFWRRWHISLGNWFKDYVYMPLAMSKLNNKTYGYLKGKFGSAVAKLVVTSTITFFVWILNGIWHGAGWKYVVFGAYMGILIDIDNQKKMRKINFPLQQKLIHYAGILMTLFFVSIGWMLIRVDSLSDFPRMIASIFAGSNRGVVANIKDFLSDMDCAVLVYGIVLLFVVELLQMKQSIRERINNMKPILKILFWIVMFFTWLVLAYDSGNEVRGFIYAKF